MSVNLNANRGTNASANIVAPSKQVTKQSKWTDLFKDKRVLGGLTAAAGLTGYLVTRVGSNENIPQPSSSFQNLAILTTVLAGVGLVASKCLRQKINSTKEVEQLFGKFLVLENEFKELIEKVVVLTEDDELYRNYAKKLQENFPIFLKVIEERHAKIPFTQNDISHLFSSLSISKITAPAYINMLRVCINMGTPLNLMIREAVANACMNEVKNSVLKLKSNLRPDDSSDLILKNIMKNPHNRSLNFFDLKIESETDYGLQVYTRLSYGLVMEQIEKLEQKNHLKDFVGNLKNLMKDKKLVQQIEGMAIFPFNQNVLESIGNVLDRERNYYAGSTDLHLKYPSEEKYFEFVENNFINYANDNLSIVLDMLCRLDEMQFLQREAISLLFTEKFVQQLCDDNIAKLKEHLNEDTNLNLMILKAVRESYSKAMQTDAQGDLVNYVKLLGEASNRISDFAHEPSEIESNIIHESHAEGLNLENPLNQQSNVVKENHVGIEEGSDRIAIQLH